MYHAKIIEMKGSPFMRVEPFGMNDHTSFYTKHIVRSRFYKFTIKPFWHPNSLLILQSRHEAYSTRSANVSISNSFKALRIYDKILVNRFRHTIKNYIESAQLSGVKNLFLLTRPYGRHLKSDPTSVYKVDVSSLFAQEVATYNNNHKTSSFRVYNRVIYLSLDAKGKFCQIISLKRIKALISVSLNTSRYLNK